MKKLLGLLSLIGLLAATLAACGGAKDYNNADVAFAQQMIPHHEQAVEMADAALKTSKTAEVRSLATQIKTGQDPEIKTMTKWLEDWDARMDHGDTEGMDHSEGMMSDAEMKSLTSTTGDEFDTTWLTLMVKHHEGAVSMAKTEQSDGKSTEAKKLAGQIIDAQNNEIVTMKGLLGS
ncbi:MAG: DUF305 domain-containing protein [Actinomycetota bacterium]|nr:DUF305 domain-containing protein [Actinomycetota bacterium]